jgi:hypothetical protein
MRLVRLLRQISLVGTILFISLDEGNAMFLKKVIFSEVKGVVLDHGRPISGATVERFVKDSNKENSDTTVTDSNGRFHFKIMEKPPSFPKLFPHETVVTQRILVTVDKNKYKAWICIKSDYDNNSELEGKPIDIICDLENEYKDNDGKFMGICRLR